MNKLIINFAPTGMIPTKEMTPHVPISPEEIVEEVLQCAELGIAIVHLHARDHTGAPTYKKEVYADILKGIRRHRPDLIIVASTSGRNFSSFEQRTDVLQLIDESKPDMASLTLSSLNFPATASVNSPDMIMQLALLMKERGIKPELEVFDLGMINFAKYMIRKGILEPPYYFNILLGNLASAQATLMHAGMLINDLPSDSCFALTGIGQTQQSMNALGVIMADGVRVGLEDNIWLDRSKNILATNSDLVRRVTALAKAYDRPLASPIEVRKTLKLPPAAGGIRI